MPTTLVGSADASNKFEDLSGVGVNIAAYANPYDSLIEACHNDPVKAHYNPNKLLVLAALIQTRYGMHRTTRNSQQKTKLTSPDFSGLIIDSVLQRLNDPSIEPGFTDSRHCLVFWARPPEHIRSLAGNIQQKLLKLAPNLWLMPVERMHLTALEITHSLADTEIHAIIDALGPKAIAEMTDHTYSHRARLIKPALSFDGAAVALSFLPAAGEGLPSLGRSKEVDEFTYHHLRRDLFNIAKATGVSIDSRYVVPSCHITIGRFLVQGDHDTPGKMSQFLDLIEGINRWLEDEFYPKEGVERNEKAEWIVGQEKGLDFRKGKLWYGGGSTVRLGKGFSIGSGEDRRPR